MVRVEVPYKAYSRILSAWPKEAWAWSEVVPGKGYRIHYLSWETLEALRAQQVLDEVRKSLRRTAREK